MAKPKHGRCNTPFSLYDHPHSNNHPPPRTLPPRFPSPTVLSALALIAAAPQAAAGPLPTPPPTFLCPFIGHDNSPVTFAPRANIPSSSAPAPAPAPTSQCAVLANKYVQGDDSLWRQTDSWTLYGSTVSVMPASRPSLRSQHVFSQCYPSSTASTSAAQPQPTTSPSSLPTSTPTAVQFDTSVLPAGWNGSTSLSSSTASTTILALAIVLACSICVFMIGCVIWRRRKKKARDVERKLGHKPSAHNDSEENVRGDARGKMRMWAKASARWKSNIRQSARRRRRRSMAPSIDNRPLSPTFSHSLQLSVVAPSTPSRRGSIASEEQDPSRPEAVSSLDGNVTEPPVVPHDPPRSASPPTYGVSFVPRFSHLPPTSAISNPNSTPSPSAQRGDLPSFIEDEPIPYIPRSDGHVATDDKRQLDDIRGLASSPPTMADACTRQSVSAPGLDEVEDDFEDLDIDLSDVPASLDNLGLPPSFPFPPPPSKADLPLPFGYLDDHPFRSGEDDILVSGSLGPSLETSPSAPPIDDHGLEPSAPSLEGEDELFQDWDGAPSYVPEAPTLADPDSAPACAIEPSICLAVSSTSRSSFSSIRESAARDGTLPRYHP